VQRTGLKSLRIDSHNDLGFLGTSQLSAVDEQRIQHAIEDKLIKQLKQDKVFELVDLLPFINSGMRVIVEDDFSRCFQSCPVEPWNWNSYLYILWILGSITRYCFLFPIRLLSLLSGMSVFSVCFILVKIFEQGSVFTQSYFKHLDTNFAHKIGQSFVFYQPP